MSQKQTTKTDLRKIAIIVIAYNRLSSLQRLLTSLENACYDGDDVPLIISIDKSDTDAVELFADEYKWSHGEKTVVKHEENIGLRHHVLSQGRWLDIYDAVVVLEDDLSVAKDFWSYTRQTVEKYDSNEEIAGISLYSFAVNYHSCRPFTPVHDGNDVYFMNCAMSWGQIWMREQWRAFEQWYKTHLEFPDMPHLPRSICSWGKKSWLKYHTRYCIEENKYFVFPYISYTTNYSEVGTHVTELDSIHQVPLLCGRIKDLRLPDFNNTDCTIYDGFFENKALYSALGIEESRCCLDLNGTNANRTGKKYWLTTRQLPYKVCRRFTYLQRPIETNVLEEREGNGIYLYDTTIAAKEPRNDNNAAFLSVYFITNSFLFIRDYGFGNIIHDFMKLIMTKFKLLKTKFK